MFLVLLIAMAHEALHAENRPDWIPSGSVSPAVERAAVQHRAYLQSRIADTQLAGLRTIRDDVDRYGRTEMRIATVPLITDLVRMEYRILNVSAGYIVDSAIRSEALLLLAHIGGAEARNQLRESLLVDSDGTVRATAALLLAENPGGDPDGDLAAVSRALYNAVRRRNSDGELHRLLGAARAISRRAWEPEHRELIESLGAIVSGSYPSSLRRTALVMLEELAGR